MIDDETMHESHTAAQHHDAALGSSKRKVAAGHSQGHGHHGHSGKGKPRANALLSRQRWEELDWDADGSITFKEFLFAMFKWCGLDDEEA